VGGASPKSISVRIEYVGGRKKVILVSKFARGVRSLEGHKRCSVRWARHFGIYIGEDDDNPIIPNIQEFWLGQKKNSHIHDRQPLGNPYKFRRKRCGGSLPVSTRPPVKTSHIAVEGKLELQETQSSKNKSSNCLSAEVSLPS